MAARALHIEVIHGPNLNLLGTREPALYGEVSLGALDAAIEAHARRIGVAVRCFQSNAEGAIVDRIQAARRDSDGFVINAGGYTHTSVAIRDALLATGLPFVEVHLTNVHAREPFRRRSLLSDVAVGVVVGFGPHGYLLALDGLVHHLRGRAGSRAGGRPEETGVDVQHDRLSEGAQDRDRR